MTSLPAQPWERLPASISTPAWKYALIVFIVARVLLSVWMWGMRQIFPQPFPPDPVLRPYLDVSVETNPWLEPWQRWDALHYQAIAERGYSAYDTALFTPPLFPVLMRLVSGLTGVGTLAAGIVLSNLAFLASLAALYQLVQTEIPDRNAALRTLIYLASFPTAFFFLAGYTESLFLLSAILSIFYFRKKNYAASGVWGAISPLTRLTGALLVVPLGIAAWQSAAQHGEKKAFLAPLLVACASAIFPLYVWLGLHMPPWTPLTIQTSRFQGGLAFPGLSLAVAIQRLFTGQAVLADWFDAGFVLLFLATLPVLYRRLPRIYFVYQAVFLLLYLSRISGMQPLLSTARYVLALYPGFIVLSLWGENPIVGRILLYGSWIGLLLLSGQFAIWGWTG